MLGSTTSINKHGTCLMKSLDGMSMAVLGLPGTRMYMSCSNTFQLDLGFTGELGPKVA